MGVSQAAINRYETGKRSPRPATLGRLADALGVEEWDLTYADRVMERRHAVERLVEKFALAG